MTPPGTTLRLVVLGALWGSSFLWMKLGLEGLSPVQLVLARLTTGGVVLVTTVLVGRHPWPRSPRLWGHFTFLALVASIIPFFLIAWSETVIPSGLAGVLNASVPFFTALIATAALPGERLTRRTGFGLLIGVAGVVLVVSPWDAEPGDGWLLGAGAGLLAAACYGVGFVYARRFLSGRDLPPAILAAGQISIAALLLGLGAPFMDWGSVRLTPVVTGSALTLGVLGTGVAHILNFRVIEDAGATVASTVTYIIPVFAVALGVLVLGEPMGWNLLLGGALVGVGIWLTRGGPTRRPG